jgi:flagellar M-ring protein FliF
VVDGSGKLLPGTSKQVVQEETDSADRALVYRLKIEKDFLDKVNATLEPLLGAKHFRAGVSVECDFSSGEQSEETFDPAKAVVATSQKSDESGVPPSSGGQPGTATNLPRPAARLTAGAVPVLRKTENVTYQNSRLVRKVRLPQGTIRRVSVGVLLDQNLRWEIEAGKPKQVLTPPSAEQMKSIKDLVTGALGVDVKRGDNIVVESIVFETTLSSEPPPGLVPTPPKSPNKAPANAPPAPDGWMGIPKNNLMVMGGVAGAAVFALTGVAVWLIRKRKKKAVSAELASHELAEGKAGASGGKQQLAAGGEKSPPPEEDEAEVNEEEAARKALQEERKVLGSIKLPETTTKKAVVLSKHIAEEAKKNPEAMAQIVRTWLNSDE